MKTLNNYRHGDVALIGIKKIPEGLKASKETVLMQNGSGGHNHSFTGGTFYPHKEGEFTVGYLKAKGTKLFHPEHTPTGELIADGIYEIRNQVEFTHEGMKVVID